MKISLFDKGVKIDMSGLCRSVQKEARKESELRLFI